MTAAGVTWRVAVAVVLAGAAVLTVLVVARHRGWVEPPVPGGAATMRLISTEQYLGAMHDLFGDDIVLELSLPPPMRRQGLISLGAANAVITPGALEQFERVARAVAGQVVDEAHRSVLVPCGPAVAGRADADCARQFLSRVGRLLYRRPLSEAELKTQVVAANAVADKSGDFYTGLAYSLAGMLASPQFLYISEVTEPDPDRPGQVRLDAYSKATRLSLFLWNALPDETLLAAAEAGELHQSGGLRREIKRLLDSPRLKQGVRNFFSDLLAFEKFDTLSKDPAIYPDFTRSVVRSAKEQSLQLIIDHLLIRKGDYRDLLTVPRVFIDATLGPLYNTPVSNPQDWIAYESSADKSAGLLTSLSFLTLHSHPGRSSPTLRGKAFRELLLCQIVPDPPPNVNFELFEDPNRKFKTARERLEAHSTDPVCAGCHKLTDPIGLALETFDGAGTFRTAENGVRIDTTGALDGRSFVDLASLSKAVREHPGLASCLTSRLYAFGIGREVGTADRPWLAYMGKRFAIHEYRLPDLLREMAGSEAFFAVAARRPGNRGSTLASADALKRPAMSRVEEL